MSRLASRKALVPLLVAVVVAAAAGSYLLLVAPERSKAARLDDQITATENQILAARRDAASGRNRVRVQVADIFRLAKAMPTSVDMPDVLLELNSIAAASNVTFESITPSVPATGVGTAYSSVQISLVFQGNYRSLANFLARLRQLVRVNRGVLNDSGRLYTVDSIQFSEGLDKFPQLQATLIVQTYVYSGAATGGAVTFTAGTPPPASQTSPSTQAATATAAGATG